MHNYKLLINGDLLSGDKTMSVINPATEQSVAQAPHASVEQLNLAVDAAYSAFPSWKATPFSERQTLVAQIADAVEAHAEELGQLLMQEQGKPLVDATMEIYGFAVFCRYFCHLEQAIKILEDGDKRKVESHQIPLGVVAAMVPWNFPIMLLAFKLAPALIAGNTLVIKPAATTPLSTLRIGEIISGILPAGTVNIITDQNELGAALTAHPKVAKVSFTGSTQTGSKVMAGAAPLLKRITLELGGNDAAIVTPSANLDEALPGIFGTAFHNAGQICIAIKRLYVHDSIYDEVCSRLSEMAEATVVASGDAQNVGMGPVQNAVQYQKVKALIESSKAHGTLIAGSDNIAGPGFFIRPTLFKDITDGTPLVDEEQFGPVLPIIRYQQSDKLLATINASVFGLGASVWGKDTEELYALANQIDAGTVWINKHAELDPAFAFGGAKQSGIGSELGESGLAEFSQTKIINIAK
jgi:acyl-CoA reductase-like NAD-dependent aldehyde dehydrogenase